MMIRLKKTLVVSSWAPPSLGASSHFFYSLFSHFSPETYVILTDSRNKKSTGNPRLPCQYFYYFDPSVPNRLRGVLRILTAGIVKPIHITKAVLCGLRVIKEEGIEVLVGTSDKGKALLLVFILSRISGLPYVLYLLDLYRWNNFSLVWCILARYLEPLFFAYAKDIVLMGEGHRELYARKYKKHYPFTVVRNSLAAPTTYPDPAVYAYAPQKPFRIFYTGSIYWAQERSIENVIEALFFLQDIPVHFEIFAMNLSPLFSERYRDLSNVVFSSGTRQEALLAQSRADLLLLPLSWRSVGREVIEMAIPGKTAEYLVSGKPILVHAPPYAYLCDYANQKGFAHVIDKEDPMLIADGIRMILDNKQYAQELIRNAQVLFRTEYNIAKNAAIMRDVINGQGT